MRQLLILSFIVFMSVITVAQSVTGVRFEQVDNKIQITYNLTGNSRYNSYNVEVFYSTNNGKQWIGPLKNVSGSVGKYIIPGNKKTIIWDVLEETNHISGNIIFKVEALPNKKPKTKKFYQVADSWIGFKTGLNLTEFKIDGQLINYGDNPYGYKMGVALSGNPNQTFTFQCEFMIDYITVDIPSASELTITNLSMPLLLKLNIGKPKVNSYIEFGIPLNLTFSNYNGDTLYSFINYDFNLLAGTGLNIYFNNYKMINLGLRYSYGISNLLNKSQRGLVYGDKWKKNTITISMTLFFAHH